MAKKKEASKNLCNAGLTLTIIFAVLIAGTIGFFIGNITQNKNAIGGIVNLVALGSSFLCGCFVPFEYMPDYVVKLAHIFPTYYFVSNNELIRNMEIFDFINVKQLGINIFIIIVYSLIFVVLTNFISKKKRVLL